LPEVRDRGVSLAFYAVGLKREYQTPVAPALLPLLACLRRTLSDRQECLCHKINVLKLSLRGGG
jgi:hypothetical protein